MNDNVRENESDSAGTDILGWIDNLPFGRFHIVLLLLTGLPMLFAGYCTQVIALVLPSILKEWGLSSMKAGTLVSWSFVGFMLGSLFFGTVADRFGRKKMLMTALALCSICTGLSYYAAGFGTLCLLRFFTGLGVGGAFPLSVSLVSEFAPSHLRARLLTIVAGSYTLGWALAALVSIMVVPLFGWRMVLAIGILPLLCVPFMGLYLPESIRFLFGKSHHVSRFFMRGSADSVMYLSREASRISRMAATPLPIGPVRIPIRSDIPNTGGLSSLFKSGYARMTILLSLTYFLCSIVLYGISSWLPALMVKAGFSLTKSFSYS
ncbi:MAG TPA: MFS transporter, partial [Syntrophorhabdaceae bacterium]|nr:MFS transporter [Syntrophorhabdaceae bacterium]